jgi:hypothetical protein
MGLHLTRLKLNPYTANKTVSAACQKKRYGLKPRNWQSLTNRKYRGGFQALFSLLISNK